MNSRFWRTVAPLALCLALITALPLRASAGPADVNAARLSVGAPSAYLIDVKTGRVLYGKNAFQPRPIASTTKIMTALLVLERAGADAEVTVSARAAATAGAKIGLKAGEKRKVGELLYALMVASGNDAASALAEYLGGNEAGFAAMMNERAEQLGAVDTRFISPHGLAPGDRHYSTAADLARITLAAFKRADFRRLVATRRFAWSLPGQSHVRQVSNSNHLLDAYPLATGVKTGFTSESGYCLVGSADQGGRSVIAVVLGSPSREASFSDARTLMDWGLKRFKIRTVVKKNRRYGRAKIGGRPVPLVADRTIADLIYDGPEDGLVLRPKLKKGLKLPVLKGQRLGRLAIMQMGRRTASVNLLAARSAYPPSSTWKLTVYFWRVVKKIENLF